MTKVQIRFRLLRPLDEPLMGRISDAHSIYGILRVRLDASLEALEVEYDASRLKKGEVEAVLNSAGIPAEEIPRKN